MIVHPPTPDPEVVALDVQFNSLWAGDETETRVVPTIASKAAGVTALEHTAVFVGADDGLPENFSELVLEASDQIMANGRYPAGESEPEEPEPERTQPAVPTWTKRVRIENLDELNTLHVGASLLGMNALARRIAAIDTAVAETQSPEVALEGQMLTGQLAEDAWNVARSVEGIPVRVKTDEALDELPLEGRPYSISSELTVTDALRARLEEISRGTFQGFTDEDLHNQGRVPDMFTDFFAYPVGDSQPLSRRVKRGFRRILPKSRRAA